MANVKIGDLVKDKGIYAGTYTVHTYSEDKTVEAYFATDFLRDASGQQLLLTFEEASRILLARNNGRKYGLGTERAVRHAIKKGKYIDGDLVFAPREFLNGYDGYGKLVRPDNNLCVLLKTNKSSLKRIRDTVNSSRNQDKKSSLSGTPDGNKIYRVKLTDGTHEAVRSDRFFEDDVRLTGVVPMRFFRIDPAPGS